MDVPTQELVAGELGEEGGQKGVLGVEEQHEGLVQPLQVLQEAQQAGLLRHSLAACQSIN